ncbi:MAG TPA: hypothetical protein VD902_18765 [Symbiobacteriaceae bacterium]|nr:hypothetical protein [Symbiobacteriaceae bacterium]
MLRGAVSGAGVWVLGAVLNQVARQANGGLFPEFAPGTFPGYINAADARLAWLGDWLSVSHYWLSIGDLFLFAGLTVLVGTLGKLISIGLRTKRWRDAIGDFD